MGVMSDGACALERAVDELIGGAEVGGGVEHARSLVLGEVLARDLGQRPPGAERLADERRSLVGSRRSAPRDALGQQRVVEVRAHALGVDLELLDRHSRSQAAAEPVARSSSRSGAHSACHAPAARSCSCSIAPSRSATRPGAWRAPASAEIAATGLCLWGMAEEPPRPRRPRAPRRPRSGPAGRRRRPALAIAPLASPSAPRARRCGCGRVPRQHAARPARARARSATGRRCPRRPARRACPRRRRAARPGACGAPHRGAAPPRRAPTSQPAAFRPKRRSAPPAAAACARP